MSFNPTVVSGFLKFPKPVPLSRQGLFLNNAHLVKAGRGGNSYPTCEGFSTPVILMDKSLTPRTNFILYFLLGLGKMASILLMPVTREYVICHRHRWCLWRVAIE